MSAETNNSLQQIRPISAACRRVAPLRLRRNAAGVSRVSDVVDDYTAPLRTAAHR